MILKYSDYYSYITNSFLGLKSRYFEENSLNYFDVSRDWRSNSLVGFIKDILKQIFEKRGKIIRSFF